jgi:hypothetical protein
MGSLVGMKMSSIYFTNKTCSRTGLFLNTNKCYQDENFLYAGLDVNCNRRCIVSLL